MAKPKVYSAEEAKERKLAFQRERRAAMRAAGQKTWIPVPDEEKARRKVLRVQRQKEWFKTEEGIAFIKKQAENNRKYSSEEERKAAQNKRKKEVLRTNIDANLKNRISACKYRAKRDGVPFDIDFEYMKSIYQDTCPYLGIKLNLRASSGNSMDALSIDKIIPELGYVKGNVEIISYKANVMKQDVDLNTLRTFAKSVLRKFGED